MHQDFGETGTLLYHTSVVEVSYQPASDAFQKNFLNLYSLFLKLLRWDSVHFVTLCVWLVSDAIEVKLQFLLKSAVSSLWSHPYFFSKTPSGRHTLHRL
jgi:hypothetical protein